MAVCEVEPQLLQGAGQRGQLGCKGRDSWVADLPAMSKGEVQCDQVWGQTYSKMKQLPVGDKVLCGIDVLGVVLPTFCAKSSGPVQSMFIDFPCLLLDNVVSFHQILVDFSEFQSVSGNFRQFSSGLVNFSQL